MSALKHAASREASRLRLEAKNERRRQRDAHRRGEALREEHLARDLARSAATAQERLARLVPGSVGTDVVATLLGRVAECAPRLLDDDAYLRACRGLAIRVWVRSPATWEPRGKGRDTLFRSLAEHLFARYRTPHFLWSAFFELDATQLVPFVLHVAGGGSAHEAVKSGKLQVPLTRRMCHELLASRGGSTLLATIRRVQFRAHGGDDALANTWMTTEPGRRMHDRNVEAFWETVIQWLSSARPRHADVGPIADYIAHRRAAEPQFSMKGRRADALLRSMREWHADLAKVEAAAGRFFRPSGFAPADFDRSRRSSRGEAIREIWHVREILTATALADEGRAMRHCVYSYASAIERGDTSIWTLTLEDNTGHWRILTIEVRHAARRVVQARRKLNLAPEARDLAVLAAWAERNGLAMDAR
jgi:hypothetical protein